MFWRRKRTKTQAGRDEEWRLLVRSITEPGGTPSAVDEARFRAYLEELDARSQRRGLRWMNRASSDDRDGVPAEREPR
ncbi:MAG TPA: hypothetical protein VHY83_02215 [Solirubrobacteraceae bacterium]|jgi:hypothetical protein|nr:hypothetical protein [Solirubrobacteraceae bacterium]